MSDNDRNAMVITDDGFNYLLNEVTKILGYNEKPNKLLYSTQHFFVNIPSVRSRLCMMPTYLYPVCSINGLLTKKRMKTSRFVFSIVFIFSFYKAVLFLPNIRLILGGFS